MMIFLFSLFFYSLSVIYLVTVPHTNARGKYCETVVCVRIARILHFLFELLPATLSPTPSPDFADLKGQFSSVRMWGGNSISANSFVHGLNSVGVKLNNGGGVAPLLNL